MATVDSLSVQVTGDSDSFERAINSAEGALSGLNPDVIETAAALQALQGRADEAGDELLQVGPKATTASAGLSGLGVSATGTSASFTGLATVTAVSLLPAIVALSAAVVPLVTALGGFVAIAGSIGGLGLAGVLGAIAVNGDALKSSFAETAAVFKDVFGPALNAATLVITNLLERLEMIAPELALGAGEIITLTDLFTDLGTAVIDLLPTFVDLAVTLTETFLPPFVEFVEEVGPQLPGIIETAVAQFAEFLPTIVSIGNGFANALPELLEFGNTVLDVIAPALAAFAGASIRAVRFVNNLDQSLSRLVAQFSLIAPIIAGIATLLSGPIALAIGGLVATIVGLGKAWQTNFIGIRDDVHRFVSLVRGVLPAAQSAFESFIQGVNISGLQGGLQDLLSTIDTELTASIKALGPLFNDFKTLLKENREEIRVIGSAIGSLIGGFLRVASVFVSVMGPVFRRVIIPFFRVFIDVLDVTLTKLSEFIQLVGALESGNISRAVSEANQLFGGAPNPTTLNLATPNQQATQELRNQIEVQVKGDTGVVEDVAVNAANSTVESRERRINRNTNTSFQPRN